MKKELSGGEAAWLAKSTGAEVKEDVFRSI